MSDELDELKARYARVDLLYQVGNVIHSTLDPQEALQLILEQTVLVMRASSGSVVLINPTSGFLEIHASMGLPDNAANLKLCVGEGITGWVAEHREPKSPGHRSHRGAICRIVLLGLTPTSPTITGPAHQVLGDELAFERIGAGHRRCVQGG